MSARRSWIRWGGVGAALCALSLLSCKEAVMEPLTVAAVEVAGGGVNLRLGQTAQLTPTLKSAKGYVLPKVGISWSSSDGAKASISPSGQVTAVSRGPVTLTASAGGASGTAAVTVIGVQSITLAPETLSVIVTQTRAMTATTVLDLGVTVTLTWRSLDTTIARVGTDGRVTATSTTGIARIEVTAEDKKDTAVVRVVPVPVVSVVVSPDTATRTVGQTLQLTATPKDSVGGTLTGRVVNWTSSDTARASVSTSGLVTVKAAGSAMITATVEGKSGSAGLTFKVPVADVTVAQSSCTGSGSFSGGTGRLYTSETCEYGALVRDAAGNSLTDRTVFWTSSDTTVAKIDGAPFGHPTTGLSTVRLLPRKAGTIVLTAAVEGKSSGATLTVLVPVASVTVTPATATLAIGSTQQLSATMRDGTGGTLTGRTVSWSSSDTAKAIISIAGLVTAKAVGGVTFTATSEGKSGTAVLTIVVPVATVTVTPATATIVVGGTQQLMATLKDSVGGTLTGRTVTWSSSDTAKTTVSNSGLVTAIAVGTATVTATSEGIAGSTMLTVAEPPGIRAKLKGPAGTGFFFVRMSGINNATDRWERIIAAGDSAEFSAADTPGASYTLRVYAVDARTDNQKMAGGWVRVLGIARVPSVTVVPAIRTNVDIIASAVTLVKVIAPDSIDAFTVAPVTWQVYDSTGMIREMANHHLNYSDQPLNFGGIGPARRDASQTVDAQNLVSFTTSIPPQEIDGIRYWRVVHWQETGGNIGPLILSLPFPSAISGEPQRQLVVRPIGQGVQLSLRAPPGTGTIFVNILGSGLTQGLWRRITSVRGDTASLRQMLPPGSNYQVRVFSVDAQTDPERTIGGWVSMTGIGRRTAVSVAAGQYGTLAIEAKPVSISNVTAPDSVAIGKSATIIWETSDTTGVLQQFGNRHIGFSDAVWGDGSIGPGRVDAQETLISAGRYRYSAAIPAQTEPKVLAWKIAMWQEIGGLSFGNILALFAPSTTWRVESPRYIQVFSPPAVSTLAITTQPAGAVSGVPFSTQPVVELRDAQGNRTTSNATVTASVASGGGTLLGTVSVAAVSGVATFTNLRIDRATAHTLIFTVATPSLTATSAAFSIASGTASRLGVVRKALSISTGTSTFAVQPVIEVLDAYGNRVTTYNERVTLTGSSGSSPSGTSQVQAVNGLATFSDAGIAGSRGFYSLTYSAPGLTSIQHDLGIFSTPPGVTAGFRHSCAISSTASANCWGLNTNGQLGNGSQASRSTPAQVSGSSAYLGLAAGLSQTCALVSGGQLSCWGNGTLTPQPYSTDQPFAALTAGPYEVCALTGEGLLFCGPQANSLVSESKFLEAAVGDGHKCAIDSSDETYCWGRNDKGQGGDGSFVAKTLPTKVLSSVNFVSIASGWEHTCALTQSGAAYCWGNNRFGQIGDGSTNDRGSPIPVQGGLTFSKIAVGFSSSCALTTTGDAYCWGGVGEGYSATPTKVPGGDTYSLLASGYGHVCVVSTTGTAKCWGGNDNGQLGNGTLTSSFNFPVTVSGGITFRVP